jgi:precorrin-2 dehydrogenase/sirohydrochlorin ferrochelatase
MSERPVLFPLFLKLEGRLVLMVGGGQEIEWKVGGLLAAGARVRIVSRNVTDGIRVYANGGQLEWLQRSYIPGDLVGVTLVIALDESDLVNESVFREATTRGIFCNIVDQPERCHFYYPAVVRRGQLQIAVSTGGLSPALASEIRKDLDTQFDTKYADWIEALGKARERVLKTMPKSPRRTRLLQRIATKRAFQRYAVSRARGGQEQL